MSLDTDIMAGITASLEGEFEKRFDEKEYQHKVASALIDWLVVEADKKEVPDLDIRIKKLQKDVERMCEDMAVTFTKDKLVVKVQGSGEETLKKFRIGTDWFEGCPELVETILSGLYNDTSSN